MKKLILLAATALLVSGCAMRGYYDKYYRYKEGEANFHAAKATCETHMNNVNQQTQIISAVTGAVGGGAVFRPGFGAQDFVSCMSEHGWLPCSQGGEGRPECK